MALVDRHDNVLDFSAALEYDKYMSINTKKIVTIGGGEINENETIALDKEIVRLSGKRSPKVLFIPTASSDAIGYWEYIDNYFGKRLGCKTEVMWLINDRPYKEEIKSKILSADIVYVGGGNSLKMMKRWRFLGVDKILKQAWSEGVILCGISAGSICWYESGHSDSMSFYNKKNWQYINVKGLGFLKGIHCPHYDSNTLVVARKKAFEAMIDKKGGFGIAIDNCCAIEYVGDKYRVVASKSNANAYKVYKQRGKVISEVIERKKEFTPLSELYKKNTNL